MPRKKSSLGSSHSKEAARSPNRRLESEVVTIVFNDSSQARLSISTKKPKSLKTRLATSESLLFGGVLTNLLDPASQIAFLPGGTQGQ